VILAKGGAFRESLVALDSVLQNGNGVGKREVTLYGPHRVYELPK
jgi:hypothetical protein